jgi:hypothetical protein
MSRLLFLLLMLTVAGLTKNFKITAYLRCSFLPQIKHHSMACFPSSCRGIRVSAFQKKMSDWKVRDGSNRNQSMKIVWGGEEGLGNS